MNLTRRTFLNATAAAPLIATAKSSVQRPNVVMFMTDDHGAWATGAYGCPEIHTPNIDTLAAGGALFSRAFACTPVCSPSRMTYMTGTLPSVHGVQDWLVPADCDGPTSRRWLAGHLTYSEVLAKNGYALGMCGKWHMGGDAAAQAGFTYWATVPGGGGTYRDPVFVHNGVKKQVQKFKTDAVGDFALDFLDRQKGEQPFYLLVPFYAPHTPYDYQPEEYRHSYNDSKFSCFPNLPPSPSQNPSLSRMFGKREPKQAYSALVTGVDTNIGRILAKLEATGLRKNTLVIFTADQGWNAGHHGVWGKGNGTIPFNMYEESLRVPLIWNHPGHIAPGQKLAPMVSSYDYFPTILDYLGINPPAPDSRRVGRSYAAFLQGRSPSWRNRLYFEYAYVRSVRSESLKYIERTDGWPSEMYDLETDPGEVHNVIADPAYRTRRDELHRELARYFEQSGAPPIADWRKTTAQKLPPADFPRNEKHDRVTAL